MFLPCLSALVLRYRSRAGSLSSEPAASAHAEKRQQHTERKLKKQRKKSLRTALIIARLVLIGMGELIDKVKEYVHEQGLGSKVEFLGNRNDVPRILNGCDCFLLPSLFEGLPVVGIEAQANGLPILFSDTITRECDITDNAEYLPINDVNIVDWANHATKANCNNRESYAEQVAEAGYSIDIEAKKLYNFYKSSK